MHYVRCRTHLLLLAPLPHRPLLRPCRLSGAPPGVKESDTGLSKPNQWDLIADKQLLEKEAPLMVGGVTAD